MHKLQYISQGKTPQEHLTNIEHVLKAGVKLIQLRLKNVSEEIYIEYGKKAMELCKNSGAQLIINDNPTVAFKCGANAVHVGLTDLNISETKKIIPGKLIGATANTFEHIKAHSKEKADYIGLGPFAFTTTKEKLSPILGIAGYDDILSKMKSENINIPVYAIGGIKLEDISQIMNSGVYGIAVSGLLTESNDKEKLVKEINKILYHA